MKLCAWCHVQPRRPDSPYCCAACADKKHEWNIHHSHKSREYRARKKYQALTEAQQIYQRERNSLKRARRLLREEDNTAHRLTPCVTVDRLNVVTWRVERVKL